MSTHSVNQDVDFNITLTSKSVFESTSENTTGISPTTWDSVDLAMYIYIQTFRAISHWRMYIVVSIIYIFGIFANALLLAYLIYYKRYKSPVFCAILSLCVSDLGANIGSLMFLSVFPVMLVPSWMCNVSIIVLNVSFISSSYHMVLFAALRFFQLVHPLASRAKVTVSLLTKICVAIWLADIIQSLGMTYFYKMVETNFFNERVDICWFFGNRFLQMIWVVVTWILLPFLTTTGFHLSKHTILLWKKSSMTSASDTDRKQTDSRALAMIVSLYLISLLPMIVQYFRVSVLEIPNSKVEVTVTHVSELIAFMNSSFNPWIYMFAAESVRTDIRKMCGRRKN